MLDDSARAARFRPAEKPYYTAYYFSACITGTSFLACASTALALQYVAVISRAGAPYHYCSAGVILLLSYATLRAATEGIDAL